MKFGQLQSGKKTHFLSVVMMGQYIIDGALFTYFLTCRESSGGVEREI